MIFELSDRSERYFENEILPLSSLNILSIISVCNDEPKIDKNTSLTNKNLAK